MKKLLFVFVLLSAITSAYAQSSRTGTFNAATSAGVVKARDTTTNTDTSYLWNGRSDHNQWGNVSLLFVNTELTGTTTNTMLVQGSDDATSVTSGHWYTLKNSTVQTAGTSDTATTKNTYYIFNIPNCQYKYLRVRNITGGTQTSVMTGTYYLSSPYIAPIN